jgi:hypothetical protein
VTNANTNRNAENIGSGQQQVRLPEQPDQRVGGQVQALRQALKKARTKASNKVEESA